MRWRGAASARILDEGGRVRPAVLCLVAGHRAEECLARTQVDAKRAAGAAGVVVVRVAIFCTTCA